MEHCIFCKIVKGEAPCYKVYEDNSFLGFLDISPFHKGHTIIIPKKHFNNMIEMPDEYTAAICLVAKKIMKVFEEGLGAAGYNILHNNGVVAGQEVPHYCLHLIPRYEENPGVLNIFKREKDPDPMEMQKMADKIFQLTSAAQNQTS